MAKKTKKETKSSKVVAADPEVTKLTKVEHSHDDNEDEEHQHPTPSMEAAAQPPPPSDRHLSYPDVDDENVELSINDIDDDVDTKRRQQQQQEEEGPKAQQQHNGFKRSSLMRRIHKFQSNAAAPAVVIGTVDSSLFTDTFSFLMTARYPCCDQPSRSISSMREADQRDPQQQPSQQQPLRQVSSDDPQMVQGKNCKFHALFGMPGSSQQQQPPQGQPQPQPQPSQLKATSTADRTDMLSNDSSIVLPSGSTDELSSNHVTMRNVLKLSNVNADAWLMPFYIGWLIVILQVFICRRHYEYIRSWFTTQRRYVITTCTSIRLDGRTVYTIRFSRCDLYVVGRFQIL